MLNSKRLTDFTNLFSPTNFKKNHEIIIEYFRHFDNSMKEKCWLITDKQSVKEFINNIKEKNLFY